MKVVKVITYVIDTGGFRLPIAEVITDEGIIGIGEAALGFGVGARAAASMIQELAQNFVIGRDPLRINEIWNDFYYDTFWGKGAGAIFYGGVSALEMALWDIKGHSLGVPVYELFGGRVRDKIQCYANDWSFDGGTPKDVARRAEQVVRDGWSAIKLYPLGGRGGSNTVNAHFKMREVRREDVAVCVEKVREVRSAVGDDVDLLVDVTAEGTPDVMTRIGREIERYDPFYYEEPLDMFDIDSYVGLKSKVNIPIAAGERLYTKYAFRRLLEQRCVDIVQPDPGTCGGIMETLKIASMAETYQMRAAPHNCGGPILTAACIQLASCLSNFLMQEIFPYRSALHYDIVNEPLEREIKGGVLDVPSRPGLGVTLNRGVVAPYIVGEVSA